MLPSIRRGVLVAGTILCFSLAGAVLAQPAPPPPDNGPDAAQHHWGDPAQREAMRAKHEAERAKRLAEALQLRPDQDGALHAYLNALKPPHDMDGDHMGAAGKGHDDMAAMTTPDRLDHMLAHFDKMRERMVARVAATKAFYAQLSADQQKAFDAMGGGFGHGDHGDRGGHDGWDHRDGGHGPDGHGPDGPGGDTGDGPHG